ncbi:MAG: sigma-54-dependent Fis family transcriptional regulator [FCB group bacterium]|nr:sigma-54-dependent Fis family transcriptional regulator [FCB group bacterium]
MTADNGIIQRILIVEDDQFAMENILLSLRSNGYQVDFESNGKAGLERIKLNNYNLVITDIKLPGMSGLEMIESAKTVRPNTKYAAITGYSEEHYFVNALQLQVDGFLKKPYEEFEFLHMVKGLLEKQALERENQILKERLIKENQLLKKELSTHAPYQNFEIIGKSRLLKRCLKQANTISQHSINALITGDSGVGKELLARYIHKSGPRHNRPFIAFNCSELSQSLMEDELFGHSKGAYTGANDHRAGLFEMADGGILLLDEVTEIPPAMQVKLLRVIETMLIRRVGGSRWQKVDVQILSATNRRNEELQNKNILRNDLYHRLAVTQIHVPTLNERIEDIEELLHHFIRQYGKQFHVHSRPVTQEILEMLKGLSWEGNVRQLSNFAQKWCLFGDDASESEILNWVNIASTEHTDKSSVYKFKKGTLEELNDAKDWLIKKALQKYSGNKSKAARHLGMTYNGLLKYLQRDNEKEIEIIGK